MGKLGIVGVIIGVAVLGAVFFGNDFPFFSALDRSQSIDQNIENLQQTLDDTISSTKELSETIANVQESIERTAVEQDISIIKENASTKHADETIIPVFSIEQKNLYDFALNLVNEDRLEHDLPPVKLGNNLAAQSHADDMFEVNYMSHWNSHGVKPYVTYTQFGGTGSVHENVAAAWCEGFGCNMDPFDQILNAEYNMMYDDAESNWGHRDNILNPNHTHVNFGITYDKNNFYFAQHFEKNLIDWMTIEKNENMLTLIGTLPNNHSLKHIAIYEDDESVILTSDDLNHSLPYSQGFYDQGILSGLMVEKLPPMRYYEECQPGKIKTTSDDGTENCVHYTMYENHDESNIDLTVDISKWSDDKIYTMYVVLENSNDVLIHATSLTLNHLK